MAKITDLFKDDDAEAWVEEFDEETFICIDDLATEGVDFMMELSTFKKIALKLKELFGE